MESPTTEEMEDYVKRAKYKYPETVSGVATCDVSSEVRKWVER